MGHVLGALKVQVYHTPKSTLRERPQQLTLATARIDPNHIMAAIGARTSVPLFLPRVAMNGWGSLPDQAGVDCP